MEERCCWWVGARPARSKQEGERYPEFARPVVILISLRSL